MRTLNALRAHYQEVRARRRKRLILRYGADPFPEHRRLVEATRKSARDARGEELYVPGLLDLQLEVTAPSGSWILTPRPASSNTRAFAGAHASCRTTR